MAFQDKALQILAEISGKDAAAITPDMELVAHLNIDSPQALQLLVALEEAFDIEISDEDAARMDTVKDVLGYLQNANLGTA